MCSNKCNFLQAMTLIFSIFMYSESNSIAYFAPSSWNIVEDFYTNNGMLSLVRCRLCTCQDGNAYIPLLLESSDEDFYEEAKILKCSYTKRNKTRLQRDCATCCEKYPLCNKFWRLCLAFDYLPFGPQIAYMCESMSFCHKLLEVWSHRQDWMDKIVDFKAPYISQFWHGSKM